MIINQIKSFAFVISLDQRHLHFRRTSNLLVKLSNTEWRKARCPGKLCPEDVSAGHDIPRELDRKDYSHSALVLCLLRRQLVCWYFRPKTNWNLLNKSLRNSRYKTGHLMGHGFQFLVRGPKFPKKMSPTMVGRREKKMILEALKTSYTVF